MDPVLAKGKAEPVPAYRLLGVLDAPVGQHRGAASPLVGRDRELRALHDAFDRTVEQRPQPPGHDPGRPRARQVAAGRRLPRRRSATAPRWLASRCVSYGQGITLWPVAQLVRQSLGQSREEIAGVRAGTPSWTRSVGTTTTGRRGRHPAHLARPRQSDSLRQRADLVGGGPSVRAAGDPTAAGGEPRRRPLGRAQPGRAARRGPTARLPTFRCWWSPRPGRSSWISQPTWGSGSVNALTLGLEPFTIEETEASPGPACRSRPPAGGRRVGDAVDGWEPAVRRGDRCAPRRAGTRRLDARGLGGHGRARPTPGYRRRSRHCSPPASTGFPADEHRLLERVAVIGLEFTTDDAQSLAGTGPDGPGRRSRLLGDLVRRDLLRRDPQPRPAPVGLQAHPGPGRGVRGTSEVDPVHAARDLRDSHRGRSRGGCRRRGSVRRAPPRGGGPLREGARPSRPGRRRALRAGRPEPRAGRRPGTRPRGRADGGRPAAPGRRPGSPGVRTAQRELLMRLVESMDECESVDEIGGRPGHLRGGARRHRDRPRPGHPGLPATDATSSIAPRTWIRRLHRGSRDPSGRPRPAGR